MQETHVLNLLLKDWVNSYRGKAGKPWVCGPDLLGQVGCSSRACRCADGKRSCLLHGEIRRTLPQAPELAKGA